MTIRAVLVDLDLRSASSAELDGLVIGISRSGDDLVVGVTTRGPDLGLMHHQGSFSLPIDRIGIDEADPRLLAMAAAAARCHLRELVLVTEVGSSLHQAAAPTGVRVVALAMADVAGRLVDDVVDAVASLVRADEADARRVGAPPYPQPWPEDPRLDRDLLATGDRRNVVDRFRYWTESAIIEDLDRTRLPVHVAVENWQHDLNIGTVVRNANAFNVAGVHIVGRRRWNRRGAMATDRYLTVRHHPTVDAFVAWASDQGLPIVGIDNVDGAVALESAPLPMPCVLAFGQEGPGLSDAMRSACAQVREITQHGSTRSLNAGVASGIALHSWAQQRAPELPSA